MKIYEKVNECLERYMGGAAFFDELDNMIKFDAELLMDFIDSLEKKIGRGFKTIASGEFGLCLHNYGFNVDILVQGGLRKGNKIIDLSPFVEAGDEFVFLDDSYFSGRTAEVIKEELEKNWARLYGCYVVYDGAYNPPHTVVSLYRYYDYHDLLGRKIKQKKNENLCKTTIDKIYRE